MDILDRIIAQKRIELQQRKEVISQETIESKIFERHPKRSLKEALQQSTTGIIAEFKRKSPSKGFIKEGADVRDIVPAYTHAGAAGISILTDEHFFGGSLSDLKHARKLTDVPILRKDFIIDEYELYVAKAIGADVILLIAATLTAKQAERLAQKAHLLNLEVLLEIHNENELEHINEYVDLVGINNRNLKTFQVDLQASLTLAEKLPTDLVKISESGISKPETIRQFKQAGFQGFLIGECFMTTEDPGKALSELIANLLV
ncbi:MAG: indole-3-glycerol phosphate synthase TrpC [Bacteroidales bacterium]|jgi:indole-3-glycerol phosphate synthase|nr:indole-3-glycerol phosphate synthase TrpC [Bacteroidales bacterium]